MARLPACVHTWKNLVGRQKGGIFLEMKVMPASVV